MKDWRLGEDVKDEEYNEVAASMLILSGVAISLVGNSRPVSGAEHKFSHGLDYLGYGKGTHGEQIGLGTIMEYFHEMA